MQVCLLLALCTAALAPRTTADESFTGDGTCYTLGQPSAGNCNMMSALNFATSDYAALNDPQWDGLQNCGRCAEVSCADYRCADPTTSVVVQILDHCPECKHGDLDLSPSVFEKLTGSHPSRYKIKWKFVVCPVSGNVNYCLKGGSNSFWTAVQPTNVATGVKDLKINGQDTTMLGSAFYYLLDGISATPTDLSRMTISMTDVNGNSIEETVSLTANSCTEGVNQFPLGGSTQTYQQKMPTINSPTPKISGPKTTVPSTQVLTPTPTPTTQMPTPSPATPSPFSPQQQEIVHIAAAPTITPLSTTTALASTLPTDPKSDPASSDNDASEILQKLTNVTSTVGLDGTPSPQTTPQSKASTSTHISSSIIDNGVVQQQQPNSRKSDLPAATAADPSMKTKQMVDNQTANDESNKISQQLFDVTSTVGPDKTPSPQTTPKSKASTSTHISSSITDNEVVQQQQPTQWKADLPAATATPPSMNTKQTADSQAAKDAVKKVNTKSGETSNGTDPLIIVLSALGAVGMVALIVVVVVVKRKNIQEQKARDVEVPSMISAQSFNGHNTPSTRIHAFGIL